MYVQVGRMCIVTLAVQVGRMCIVTLVSQSAPSPTCQQETVPLHFHFVLRRLHSVPQGKGTFKPRLAVRRVPPARLPHPSLLTSLIIVVSNNVNWTSVQL